MFGGTTTNGQANFLLLNNAAAGGPGNYNPNFNSLLLSDASRNSSTYRREGTFNVSTSPDTSLNRGGVPKRKKKRQGDNKEFSMLSPCNSDDSVDEKDF